MLMFIYYVIALYFWLNGTSGSFLRGNYIVDVEAGSLCPDNDQLEIPMRKFRIDRVNRTHRAVTVNFSLARPIDNSTEGTVILERWTQNGWSVLPNVFSYQPDPCNKIMKGSLQFIKDKLVEYGAAMGIKNIAKCEIPPGNYSADRLPVEVTAEVPFWTGRLRSTVIARRIQNKKKVMCFVTLTSIK